MKHIALCHDQQVPALRYGGTERVVAWLARGLLRLGHRVSLIAAEGSAVPGTQLIEVPRGFNRWQEVVPPSVDLMHLWNTPSEPLSLPYLVTIGGHGQTGEVFHPNTVFVSKRHAALHGSEVFVHHGLPIDDIAFEPHRVDSYVFLAKASWKVKNVKGAIEVARRAHVKLDILGSRLKWPRFHGVKRYGMADDLQKGHVLSQAKGLFFQSGGKSPLV